MADLLAAAKKHEAVIGKPMTEWTHAEIDSFAEALHQRRQNITPEEDRRHAENR